MTISGWGKENENKGPLFSPQMDCTTKEVERERDRMKERERERERERE